MTREAEIEDYLVLKAAALGGEVRKLRWIGRVGAPDRLVMLPEKVFGKGSDHVIPAERFLVELKAPGKKPRGSQLREHDRLRKFGWRVEVVDSFERVDEVLR